MCEPLFFTPSRRAHGIGVYQAVISIYGYGQMGMISTKALALRQGTGALAWGRDG